MITSFRVGGSFGQTAVGGFKPMVQDFKTTVRQSAEEETTSPRHGIRPLILRIGLVGLLVFFGDVWIDILFASIDLFGDGLQSLIDWHFQIEKYLVLDVIKEKFDLSDRSADFVAFYGLLPLELLIAGYFALRLIRWMKRLPGKLQNWLLKEKALYVNSWQQLPWYWKLGIIGGISTAMMFMF